MARSERRRFLSAAIALVAAAARARAQQGKVHRIAFLSPVRRGPRDEAFANGLRELGYVEGRNLELEMRFADGRPDRLPELVAELIRLNPDVLVVGSTIGARAAKQATTTLPIVFAGSSDPVAGGIVSNLARPGGNITGFSLAYGDGFAAKWLELLKEAVPRVSQVAVLWSSSNAAAAGYLEELRAAARALDVALQAHQAAQPQELAPALKTVGAGAAQGLIVMPSPFAASQRTKLVEFASVQRLPAMYFSESFVEAGGLMSYGPSIVDTYRRAAGHVDKILKGARPGDLPVEQPTRFELSINAPTARTLGLTIPQSLLVRADRVIG
jgi:putative ABC transport system substrate-binding protein